MIALRNSFFGGKAKAPPTIHGYVADGLIAMWDAIDNVGLGDEAHSSTTTELADLSGNGYTLTVANDGTRFSWKEKSRSISLYGSGSTVVAFWLDDAVRSDELSRRMRYAEGCWTDPTRGNKLVYAPSLYRRLHASIDRLFAGRGSPGVRLTNGNVGFHTYGVAWLSEYGVELKLGDADFYIDGEKKTPEVLWDTSTEPPPEMFSVGGWYGHNYQMVYGNWHSTRIYDRALTPEEVAHNYAVDLARFGTV